MASLNPDQEKAAKHESGPALVIAGPGAGKTRTLVARYYNLVQTGVDPASIFTVTFTRKSAQEFKRRIQSKIGINTNQLPIGTFNSLARYKCLAGKEFENKELLKGSRYQYKIWHQLDVKGDDRRDAELYIQQWKNHRLTPQEVQKAIKESKVSDIKYFAKVYENYTSYLEEHSLYDFTDQIGKTLNYIEANPRIRKRLTNKFQHILVDEYQDINQLQFEFLQTLAGLQENIWIVGDIDQSIYSFRGSSISFISEFSKHFTGAQVYHLSQTYRYGSNILNLSKNLISYNASPLRTALKSEEEHSGQAIVLECEDETSEAIWIATLIEDLLEKGLEPQDIAILARCHYVLKPIAGILAQRDIPHLHIDDSDAGALWNDYIVRIMLYVLSQETKYPTAAPGGKSDYYIEKLQETLDAVYDEEFPEQVKALADHAKHLAPKSAEHERVLEWAASCLRFEIEASSHEDYESLHYYISAQKEDRKPRQSDKNDKVLLTSIHQAKGLEWNTVIVAGCENKTLPHIKSLNREDIQEERRLAYVALTRAINSVVCTWCNFRGGRENSISPFISELAHGDHTTTIQYGSFPANEEEEALNSVSPGSQDALSKPTTLKAHQRISHKKFGRGKIIKLLDGQKAEVLFDRGGKKVMLLDYLTSTQ